MQRTKCWKEMQNGIYRGEKRKKGNKGCNQSPRWLFPVNKHSFFYQNIDIGWTGTHILTLDFIILCLFSGSKLGSSVTSGVTRRQSRVYFMDCKGTFTPHTSYLGTKKYPSFTKSRTCGGLKKDPFFREIHNAGAAPLCTWVPPPKGCHKQVNKLLLYSLLWPAGLPKVQLFFLM